jgi:hypothetical protein
MLRMDSGTQNSVPFNARLHLRRRAWLPALRGDDVFGEAALAQPRALSALPGAGRACYRLAAMSMIQFNVAATFFLA